MHGVTGLVSPMFPQVFIVTNGPLVLKLCFGGKNQEKGKCILLCSITNGPEGSQFLLCLTWSFLPVRGMETDITNLHQINFCGRENCGNQKTRRMTDNHSQFCLSSYLSLLDCGHEKARSLQFLKMRNIDLSFIMERETLRRCVPKSLSFVDKMKDVTQNECVIFVKFWNSLTF